MKPPSRYNIFEGALPKKGVAIPSKQHICTARYEKLPWFSSGHTYIWVNYNDLTATEHWNHDLCEGNHPQLAQQFRLVKYFNLPRYIYIYVYITLCLFNIAMV